MFLFAYYNHDIVENHDAKFHTMLKPILGMCACMHLYVHIEVVMTMCVAVLLGSHDLVS